MKLGEIAELQEELNVRKGEDSMKQLGKFLPKSWSGLATRLGLTTQAITGASMLFKHLNRRKQEEYEREQKQIYEGYMVEQYLKGM